MFKVLKNAHEFRNGAVAWWGLVALALWAFVLLETVEGVNLGSLFVLLAYAATVFALTMTLRPCAWRPALLLFGFGTLWFALTILFVQQFPQAAASNPDSLLYDLQSRALDLHWHGRTVPTEPFGILPFENPDGSRAFEFWRPGDGWGLGMVMGTSHFAYQVYVAALYFLADVPPQGVILSHAALLGALPILAFGIAARLFTGRPGVPMLAALLVMLDLNFSVSAAWLLKDTLVTWATALAVLGSIDLVHGRARPAASAVIVTALIVLAVSRVHVFYVLIFLIFSWSVLQWPRTGKRRMLPVVVIFMAWAGAGASLISDFTKPASDLVLQASTTPLSALKGFQHVMGASFQAALVPPTLSTEGGGAFSEQRCAKEGAVDGVVCDFQASLREAPFWTLTRSAARTLFAPYPWVAIHPGLTWESLTELYYPGTLLWISLLPFFALGVALSPRGHGSGLVLALATIICLIYIAVLGEFSTRQRQFLMPILVPFSAWGITRARQLWQRRRRGWGAVELERQSS